MKKKLMKLIKEAESLPNPPRCAACMPPETGERNCEQCKLERKVDYLIENGVTVKEE